MTEIAILHESIRGSWQHFFEISKTGIEIFLISLDWLQCLDRWYILFSRHQKEPAPGVTPAPQPGAAVPETTKTLVLKGLVYFRVIMGNSDRKRDNWRYLIVPKTADSRAYGIPRNNCLWIDFIRNWRFSSNWYRSQENTDYYSTCDFYFYSMLPESGKQAYAENWNHFIYNSLLAVH